MMIEENWKIIPFMRNCKVGGSLNRNYCHVQHFNLPLAAATEGKGSNNRKKRGRLSFLPKIRVGCS